MLIGEELPSLFFRVLGTIFGTAVILLWIMLAIRTAIGGWKGHLFNAPCLANLKPRHPPVRNESSDEEKTVGSSESDVVNTRLTRRITPGSD